MQNRFYVNESKAKLMLFAHRRNNNSLLSQIPLELIELIMNVPMTAQDAAFVYILEDAAFGRLDILQAKLESNPYLVLGRGSVITPGGLEVEDTTILECAIGGGDPEMIAMIKPYFAKIEKGEEELEKQLERYRPCLATMKTQKPYDLTGLIKLIKASARDVVTPALDAQYDPRIELHQALIEFREAVNPKTVSKPQMHYNYQTLIHAYTLFQNEWRNLYNATFHNDTLPNYGTCNLVWRQVIGYLQRSLPAVDRFVFAQGFYNVVNNVVKQNTKLKRDAKYQVDWRSFPDFSVNSSDMSGLGFDYGLTSEGTAALCGVASVSNENIAALNMFMSDKNLKLEELLRSHTDLTNRPSM